MRSRHTKIPLITISPLDQFKQQIAHCFPFGVTELGEPSNWILRRKQCEIPSSCSLQADGLLGAKPPQPCTVEWQEPTKKMNFFRYYILHSWINYENRNVKSPSGTWILISSQLTAYGNIHNSGICDLRWIKRRKEGLWMKSHYPFCFLAMI